MGGWGQTDKIEVVCFSSSKTKGPFGHSVIFLPCVWVDQGKICIWYSFSAHILINGYFMFTYLANGSFVSAVGVERLTLKSDT